MATKTYMARLYQSPQFGYEMVTQHDYSAEAAKGEYILLGSAEVTFEIISEDEQVAAVIKGLESAKQKEMADSHMRIKALDERIQNLLAITHTPA